MGEKKQINDKFIPTSLFRGHPLISVEWATTKQACRDELLVYLFFFSHTYFTLLLCIEHCFTNIKFHTCGNAFKFSFSTGRTYKINEKLVLLFQNVVYLASCIECNLIHEAIFRYNISASLHAV